MLVDVAVAISQIGVSCTFFGRDPNYKQRLLSVLDQLLLRVDRLSCNCCWPQGVPLGAGEQSAQPDWQQASA